MSDLGLEYFELTTMNSEESHKIISQFEEITPFYTTKNFLKYILLQISNDFAIYLLPKKSLHFLDFQIKTKLN